MAKIEGFRIKNFRALKDIQIGRLWNDKRAKPLTSLTAVVGKNGVGKSTLFDAFGLLSDCLKEGVGVACNKRGGLQNIKSANVDGPVEFYVYYRQDGNSRPITYELAIDVDEHNKAFVKKEVLKQRQYNRSAGTPLKFLDLENGKGYVWNGDFLEGTEGTEANAKEYVELSDNSKLGISVLGALTNHPRIANFVDFIESWYLSYFSPEAGRSLPLAGPQVHLNKNGDNLGNFLQYMEQNYPDKVKTILKKISNKIPGLDSIQTETTQDNRLLIKFNNKGYQDPFYAQYMSDGTLKLFAYLLLMEDPDPAPFVCIEEPENGLYHKLLEILANEFRNSATGIKGGKGGSQIFITTHQPYLINALRPDEVWVLEKQDDGFSTISRASDNPLVKSLYDSGIELGSLWYSDYFDKKMQEPGDAY